MMGLLETVFTVPSVENMWLPGAVHLIPGVRAAVDAMLKMIYFRGVMDGLLSGVLFTSAFWLIVYAIINRKRSQPE